MKPFVIDPQFELHRNPDDEAMALLVYSHYTGRQVIVDVPVQGEMTDREYRKRVLQPGIAAIKSNNVWQELNGVRVH